MRNLVRLTTLLAGLASHPLLATDLPPDAAAEHARGTFREYFELLALPNDAVAPADIVRNVAWLDAAFRKRGFTTTAWDNDGKPMLFAELADGGPERKTVLFYMHLDGQPVIPEQWAQASPWVPVLKRRTATGDWEAIDAALLASGPIDPEWRVFGRSAADDKAPIMMFLAAIDALQARGDAMGVNIKVLLDSEEEKGSPSIGKVMLAHRARLRSDAIVIHDGPMHESNRPTLVFGNRGVAMARLTVHGAKVPLHSGHYGNYSPNPAQRLASLLASMKDETGRVTIPGYYDRVRLGDEDRRIMAAVPDDDVALKKRLGIAGTDQVGANYQEAMQYPSFNVRGMSSAAVGDKVANIVPDQAVAEIDVRTTPDASAAALARLIEAHIEQQGYHLVDGTPTDDDRNRYPKLASLVVQAGGGDAARTPIDSAVGRWAYSALVRTWGDTPEPVRIRMMGGTLPTADIVGVLHVPFVIVPLVNADNNQHAANENMRIGHYVDGVRTIYGLITQPFADE